MEREISKAKWEAKFSRTVANASADQIWPFLQDFFGIYKYFPSLSTSYGIHGSNGEIGSIRHCQGSSIPSQESDEIGQRPVSWTNERLIAIDFAEKSLSYEIVDGNIGFNSYVSTIKIVPKGGEKGCVIKWSFSVDPIEGLGFEDLVNKYQLGLQRMADKMEDALSN